MTLEKYMTILDSKIVSAFDQYQQAEKHLRQAKAEYIVLREEKKKFESVLTTLGGEKSGTR